METIMTLYTKPGCVQCTATEKALVKRGIEFAVIDVTEDAAALAKITALGYLQAPVVVTGSEHWSGFRPDRIRSLK